MNQPNTTTENELPLLLTVPQAARRLGVKELTMKKLCESKEIPSERLANRTMIPAAALEAYAASFGGAA